MSATVVETSTAPALDIAATPAESLPSEKASVSKDGLDTPNSPTAKPEDLESAAPRRVTGFKWFLVIAATLSSVFIYALDNTIVADIVPAIVNDFNSVGELAWLSVGFVVGGVAVVLPFGKLYGLFNAKWLYIISCVVFLAASALCGAAPNMPAEIVGRVIAGMSGNGLYLGVVTLLSVSTTDQERPIYLSLIGLVWGIGTVLGPVVGGAFEQNTHATWRWAFYINLIIGGVFAPVYFLLLPPFDPAPKNTMRARFGRFDYLGAVLSIGCFISIIMAINFGGTLYAWGGGQTIALFVVAGVLFIAFALQQVYSLTTTPHDRLFPIQFLKNRDAVLLFIATASINAAAFVPIYYIPIYFQFARNDDALQAAVRLLPLICLLSFTILANGHFMSRFGYYQPWYIIGGILALIGGALLSTISLETSTSRVYGYEVLLGLGTGASVQASYAVIQTVIDASDMAYGISFIMMAQLGGISLGLAVASSVFVNRAVANLTKVLPNVPRDQLQQLVAGTSNSVFSQIDPSIKNEALALLVGSLRKVFIPVYVAAAVALLASLLLKPRKAFIPVAAGG